MQIKTVEGETLYVQGREITPILRMVKIGSSDTDGARSDAGLVYLHPQGFRIKEGGQERLVSTGRANTGALVAFAAAPLLLVAAWLWRRIT